MKAYMISYLQGGKVSFEGPDAVEKHFRFYEKEYPAWNVTEEWLANVTREVLSPVAFPFSYNDTALAVQEVGERYGSFNDGDCAKLKAEMLSIESNTPGRVRLPDFYKKGLYGYWEFNERIEYLRTLGALDESQIDRPQVIIPNYVSSRPNCLVSSGFYVVCCRNECEDLLGSLERDIGASSASPARILALVANLPSATSPAPQQLSSKLKARLEEVAARHGGEVPLHGRLFAQWLHHVFPRECPYPHEAGTVSPQTPDEWMQEKGGAEKARASKEEMMEVVNDAELCKAQPPGDLPWTPAEELLTEPATPKKNGGRRSGGRMLATAAAFCSMAYFLVWVWQSLNGHAHGGKKAGRESGLLPFSNHHAGHYA